MIGVRFPSLMVTTLQITTFGPWKHVNSTLQTWGWYQMTSHAPPLRSTSRRSSHWQVHHVASQYFAEIRLVGDLGIRQYHYFKAANMFRLDDLHGPRVLSIADVEGLKGNSQGVRRLSVRWRWHHVEAAPAMSNWPGDTNGNHGQVH